MAKKKRKIKELLFASIIGLIAFITSFILIYLHPFQVLELNLKDQLFEWRGPMDVSDSPIVMVAISQQADEEIPEKYPWPTNLHAKLVENLNEAGAKVIAFDVLFEDPDMFNARNDTLFAEAIQEHGNVILAGELNLEEGEFGNLQEPQFPLEIFRKKNPNKVGLVRVNPDLDGTVRSYSFGNIHRGTDTYYRFGLEVLRQYHEIPYSEIDEIAPNDNEYFTLGPYNILKDGPNSFLINFYGPEGLFPVISYDEVLDDSSYTTVMEDEMGMSINTFDDPLMGYLEQNTFKDKIVIIGSTMPALGDFHSTPFANDGNNPRSGYEIHAHAIQTILDNNYIERYSGWYIILIMFLFSLSIALTNKFGNATKGWVLSLLLGIGYFGLAYWAFVHHNIMLFITGPILAAIITQVGTVSYEYYVEQKEKKRIQGMFSSYVSPELVHQMIESGEEPQLGGEEKYITAFFSDIVSFSTFSEKLEAKELVELINDYLSEMTEVLNERGGTLDKYIGDAIVSFFGAPVYIQDHALQACISSQLMHKRLAKLREKWEHEGWPDIVVNMQHRIGMNTGEMVTGNMGSIRRFNYTMMGDNVNLAARCESGAKQYGVFTMVTESTKNEAEQYGDDCVFRLLDNIVVKGRTKPVKVYEIADLKEDADQKLQDCIGLYEEGMQLYFAQEWDKATSKFKKSEELERYDQNPSGIFVKRCNAMKKDPPESDWNGVYIMKSK